MGGLEEEARAFTGMRDFTGLARFRRFGSEGPIYEVLERRDDRVLIQVVESDEATEYPLSSALADPLA